MGCIVPSGGYDREFRYRRSDHDESGNCSTERRGGPYHRRRRVVTIVLRVDVLGVVRGEEEVDGDVEDPDSVEVDE